jgi:hypothetical protein
MVGDSVILPLIIHISGVESTLTSLDSGLSNKTDGSYGLRLGLHYFEHILSVDRDSVSDYIRSRLKTYKERMSSYLNGI